MSSDRLPRRLACIVYADVVGYSRLSAENEDKTFHSLQSVLGLYSSLMIAYGGRVVNRAGDALLVSFDSTIAALAASIAAQRAIYESNRCVSEVERVTLRVGINVGDIIENGADIFGHGINVAARIQSVAEPGGICVSEAVKQMVPTDLDVVFRSIGMKTYKNLREPILTYAVDVEQSQEPSRSMISSLQDIETAREVTPIEHVSFGNSRRVLILPFSTFGNRVDLAHLTDGLCEDIITELSRFKSIAVLARTTAFAFKGTTKTIREIGSELNVNYVLEGSLRPFGSGMRITVQLIDPSSEGHIWAEKYDFELPNLLVMQDELVSKIVSVLEGKIVKRGLRAIGKLGPLSLDAYECWLKGHALMQSWRIGDDEAALVYFKRAVELEPTFARPRASMAGIYSAWALLTPGSPYISSHLSEARSHAEAAVELDPEDGKVGTYIGWVDMLDRAYGQAALAFDLAGESSPNDAEVTISRALAYAYLGDAGRANDLARRAFSLDPYRPSYYYGYRAVIMFLNADYTTSVELFESMKELIPVDLIVWYASALAHLGEHERSSIASSAFLKLVTELWKGDSEPTPFDIVEWFLKVTPIRHKADLERLQSGLHGGVLSLA